MLEKLKISQKVYTLGIIQLGLMLIMGIISISQMNKIGTELIDIAEEDIPLTNAITKITEHQLEQAILVEKALFKAALTKLGNPRAENDLKSLVTKINLITDQTFLEIKQTKQFVGNAIPRLHSEEAVREFQAISKKLSEIEQHYGLLMESTKLVLANATAQNFDLMIENGLKLEIIEDPLKNELIELLHKVESFTLKSAQQAEQDEKSAIVWMSSVFVVAVLLGMSLPFIIARAISSPVVNLESRLKQIADGDGDLRVTLKADARDETGDVARAFNRFMEKLRKLIAGTNHQADSLGESAETALSVMQKTLENVEKQRTETELVASAVNQMSATTQEVARSAHTAATVTDEVTRNVVDGRREALDTQSIITQLTEEVEQASGVIQSLVTETNKIGSVLDSIQGIAEQTNLLALNAAIEAARAGESGRGFAVVADEVRSLAQRTQSSTVDIQGLVESLQLEASNAVTSMDKGRESAQLCLQKASTTAETFEKASTAVGQISDLNAQIAAAAEEQSIVAEEINKNLIRIKEVADTTAAGAKQTELANRKIATSLIDLHTSLNIFQT